MDITSKDSIPQSKILLKDDPFQGSSPLMNQISVIFGPSLNNCDIINERNLPMSQKLI